MANTANTFDTSNTIVGTYSGATATPNLITANNLTMYNGSSAIEYTKINLIA